MTFSEAESYLLSLGNEVLAMKLGLENVLKLLAALGDLRNKYLKVQVAGTNGKGSVCAFLDSICREAGIRTGVTTSPHLVSMTERVRIDGSDISEAEFARLATRVRKTSERLVSKGELESAPTYFEQVTAIALLAFAEAKVDLAILETGLGGRLDATTAARAEICAITRIDIDHQKILGETLAEIALEKAAVIRVDSTVVIGQQEADVSGILGGRCETLGVRPYSRDSLRCWFVEWNESTGGTVTISTDDGKYPAVNLGLNGRHQAENAEVALFVASALRDEYGWDIRDEHIVAGLENARHPGRLEYFDRYLLDGAHNIGGAKALVSYLEESVNGSVTFVFGAMRDKDVSRLASILFPTASAIVFTKADNIRSVEPDELAKSVPPGFAGKVQVADRAAEALKVASEITPPGGFIVVTGSLYLVGEARAILLERTQI